MEWTSLEIKNVVKLPTLFEVQAAVLGLME